MTSKIEEIDLQLYVSQQFVEPVQGLLIERVGSRDLTERGRKIVPPIGKKLMVCEPMQGIRFFKRL